MTNTELIARIATMLLDADDLDIIDFMTDMRELLAPSIHAALCDALELCSMHICDYRICLDDDNPDCAHLNNI